MDFNWIYIAPIVTALFVFFCPIIVNRKERNILILSGVLSVFNIYTIFSMINSFRRDYGSSFEVFPIFNYISYLMLFNAIFLIYNLIFLLYFDKLKQTYFIKKIQNFFYSLRDNIFKIDKRKDRVLSLLLVFIILYIVGFTSLFTHEFGHAMANIIFGRYFDHIEITLSLQGLTYGGGSIELQMFQRTILYLAGLISETIFALIALIFLLSKKEKNKFSFFLSIAISMLFLNRVALYFTFPQLLGITSDTFSMVTYLGYDPWILFLIFLPYLIITVEITLQLIKKFYRSQLSGEKDFISIFILGLVSYILFLVIMVESDNYIDPFLVLNFY